MLKTLQTAADHLKGKIKQQPDIGIILGTGLNSVADLIEDPTIVDYQDVPQMPSSTAPSHKGRFVFGELSGKQVVIMQGRLHYYEGYSMQQITFPIRLLKLLGIETLIITNAAGSLNEDLQPGDLVVIDDHINFTGDNPLIGKNLADFGERFPSFNQPYSKRLRDLCDEIAREKGFQLKHGVYTGLAGPSLETRAECKMLQKLGSDLVGMSTVPEVIVAVHSGMEVLGISTVTNLSNIFHSKPHSQEEIWKYAEQARVKLEYLINNIIEKI
ncbi:MAG: purine-nucleoside phosphorylase [Candidatus Cloacimonetes bacterium]|nr:purine-nucleoside phosphorylase [Candidatus Cloacimonadota bacterium]